MAITEFDKAWIAGVMEFSSKPAYEKSNRCWRATIANRNYEAVKRLARLTGYQTELRAAEGNVKYSKKPCVDHCPEPHVHVLNVRHDSYGVRITALRLAIVTINCESYFTNPKPFKECAIEDWTSGVIDPTYRKANHTKRINMIKRMSRLGWDVSRIIVQERSEVL